MIRRIRSAAVLGAGTMGAQIAAHLANAGVPTHLLDMTAAIAREGLKRAASLKPDPFFTRDAAALISIGGFDQDMGRLADADWVLEAVVERLDAKQALLEQVERVRRPGTIVSSNTSGIPIAALAEGRSDEFRRHWLGTHFFNPPRYLRLVELIPTAETDTAVLARVFAFVDHDLGKGVVVAKDTPNFIANHIALFGVVQTLRALESGDYSIEEIDAITGPAIGRPKSATFRTMDIAGIDVLGHVMSNLATRLAGPERTTFKTPALIASLIERGWVGEKAGRGFYRKEGADILTLDPTSYEYRAKQPVKLPALDAAKSIDDVRERIRTLFFGPDKVGAFLRATLGPTLFYTAHATPDIAYSINDVDRAMKWGFGWELGPFETWDALGIRNVLKAIGAKEAPPLVADILQRGNDRFLGGSVPPAAPDLQILRSARERERIVKRNAGASLLDIGDGVLAVDFHSKMNTIGGDTVAMLDAGVQEAEKNFAALVIGTEAPDFSVGANLMLVLLEAQEGNWDEIDLMVRTLQRTTQALRYANVPVVVCPCGMTLGGGCEILLHGDRVQAAAESYIGLVEVGVGLIPAAGGTKEMLARATASCTAPQDDLLDVVQPVFETIGFGKVSTSAAQARQLGFLTAADGVTMNRERLISDAKAVALARVRDGYRPPPRRTSIPVGGETLLAALNLGVHLAWRAGRIGDHDAVVGRTLARVLAGGALPHRTTVNEDYILDLEREAFVRLCGERKTLERIQYTLKTGKTLRN